MTTKYRCWTVPTNTCKTSIDIIIENIKAHFGSISPVTLTMVRYLANNNKSYSEIVEVVSLWNQTNKEKASIIWQLNNN